MGTYLEKGKQAYLRFQGRQFLVEIADVAQDTIAVDFPGSNYPIEGLGVDLEFHEPHGVACYHTQVVAGPRQPGDGIILQRAASLTRRIHRGAWRVPLNARTQLRKPFDPEPSEGLVLNVSSEGALLETQAVLEVDNVVDFALSLPGQPPYEAVGRVIRKESPTRERPNPRYGVILVSPTAELKRALILFVWQQLRELYPNEIRALLPKGSKRRVRS